MIKIKYLTSCSGAAGDFPAGSVREINEAKGLYLVSIKRAELVVEETKETPKNEVSNNITTSGRANKSNRGKRPSKN
jgi:hypothetical protein